MLGYVEPPSIEYERIPIPPLALMVIVPSVKPLQEISFDNSDEIVIAEGSLIVTLMTKAHPALSVTVAEWEPPGIFVSDELVPPVDQE